MSVLEQLFLAVFEHKAPDNNLSNSVLAVKQAAAAAADTSIMMSQTAFRLSETHWMGRAIKYAGLHGVDVHVVAAHPAAEGPSLPHPPLFRAKHEAGRRTSPCQHPIRHFSRRRTVIALHSSRDVLVAEPNQTYR